MTGKRICTRRPKAIEDIDGHVRHIATESITSALKFVDQIEETVEIIMQFPESGGRFVTQDQRLVGVRAKLVSQFPRYAVFYVVGQDTIEIIRVIAGGQEFDAILSPSESVG